MKPPPNQEVRSVNPTPKQRFLANGRKVSYHADLIANAEFVEAIDAALLEMQRELTEELKTSPAPAAVAYKLAGAQQFLQIFRRLGQSRQEMPRTTNQTLRHDA